MFQKGGDAHLSSMQATTRVPSMLIKSNNAEFMIQLHRSTTRALNMPRVINNSLWVEISDGLAKLRKLLLRGRHCMQRMHVAFHRISKFHFNYMVLVAISTSTRTECVSSTWIFRGPNVICSRAQIASYMGHPRP